MDENLILNELKEIRKLLSLQKEVFTLDELCTYTGLSKNQAYHLTSYRKIPFYRPFGKKMYFKKEDVIELLNTNAVNSSEHLNRLTLNKIV